MVSKDNIYIIGGNPDAGCQMLIYSISKDKWTTGKSSKRKRERLSNAVHVPRSGHIYVFGGQTEFALDKASLVTYERYNVAEKEWDKVDTITTSKNHGDRFISTCYDGNRYIYLAGGGKTNGTYISRIDRFDTVTFQFTNIGRMAKERLPTSVFYHQNAIYLVAGQEVIRSTSIYSRFVGIRDPRFQLDIICLNAHTGQQTTVVDNLLPNGTDYVLSSCFDGSEYVYYITNTAKFYKVSLASKIITPLASAPLESVYFNHLLYVSETDQPGSPFKIYHFQNMLVFYDSETGRWNQDLTKPSVSHYPLRILTPGMVVV
eukprot:gene16001-19039_t